MRVAQRGNMQHSEIVEESTNLGFLWHLLCAGRLFIATTHCSEGRCFAQLRRQARPSARPSALHLQTLQRVLEGESQKVVASDLGVSIATVAGNTNLALRAMMCPERVSRAPILLVMAAFAVGGLPLAHARLHELESDDSWTISVEVPGKTFRDRLSLAELVVAGRSIEGESHASIASSRGSSIRTVANQLGAAFVKLEVSGRSELRVKAVREHAANSSAAVATTTTSGFFQVAPLAIVRDEPRFALTCA
jgi:DNA-binding CsgD family transcriptional regulator